MHAPNVLLYRCSFCAASTPDHASLHLCSGCKAARYCTADHQSADWSMHKPLCVPIKRARRKMEAEEEKLKNTPADNMWMNGNPFDNHVGHFWGILDTRDYMRARIHLVDKILKICTKDAVETSLEHLLDMLRLCRSDNLGVRDIIPGLYLRLHRDQESYDFMKWYATKGQESGYDWGNISLPFLNLKDEDPIEDPGPMWTGSWVTAHAIAILMIKLRMLLDLRDLDASTELYKLTGTDDQKLNVDIVEEVRGKLATRSAIWPKRPELLASEGMKERMTLLDQQVNMLFASINKENKYFWNGLLEYEKWWKLSPSEYSSGSKEEMILLLQYHTRAWIETEGALEWVKLKMNIS